MLLWCQVYLHCLLGGAHITTVHIGRIDTFLKSNFNLEFYMELLHISTLFMLANYSNVYRSLTELWPRLGREWCAESLLENQRWDHRNASRT